MGRCKKVGNHQSGVIHKRRAWLWLATFMLTFFIIALIFCVYALYHEAREIQAHENSAIRLVSNAVETKNVEANHLTFTEQVKPAKKEAEKADQIIHGPLWNLTSKLPVLGSDVRTVQGMTGTLKNLVSNELIPLAKIADQLERQNLNAGDGEINTEPIIKLQKALTGTNGKLKKEVASYTRLPEPHLKSVRKYYNQGDKALFGLSNRLNQVCGSLLSVQELLGANGERTFAVLIMSPSEARSTGGLVGSVGTMTAHEGEISVGNFRPNTDYIPYGAGNPSTDELNVFQTNGPLHMSLDIRDLASYPNITRTAEQFNKIWKQTPWGNGQNLDGILIMDPVFFQEIIKLHGNISLADGTVLNGDNTAEFLLNTVYIKYPPAVQDLYFSQIAQVAIKSIFSNIDITEIGKDMKIVEEASSERHFSMYSFDSNLQSSISRGGFSGPAAGSESEPKLGIFINEQISSKMDWYIQRSATIKKSTCEAKSPRNYSVVYQFKNVMTKKQVYTLPNYITGGYAAGGERGHGVEKVLLYPPEDGDLTNIVVDKMPTKVTSVHIGGKKAYMLVVDISPESSVDLSFVVLASNRATGDMKLDQTPLVRLHPPVEYEYDTCVDKSNEQ